MTVLMLLLPLVACVRTGSAPAADAPRRLVATFVDDAGAAGTFTAHLTPGGAYAMRFDYDALEAVVVSDATGARATNFSGQIESLSTREQAEFDRLAGTLRTAPPKTDTAWTHHLDGQILTYTFSEVRRLKDTDPSISLVARQVGSLEAERTEVPLQVLPSGHLAVPVQMGDASMTFLVDSGAGISLIDANRAASLGIEGVLPVAARGIGGTETVQVGAPTELTVGEATLSLALAQYDLGPIAEGLGMALDGVLGKEAFNAFVVGFDRSRDVFTLYDRSQFSAPRGYEAVPLAAGADGRWRAPAQIEGQPPGLVDLDTGSNGTLLVYHAYAQATALTEGRPVGSWLIGGVGGARTVSTMHVGSVTFAGHVWTDVPITVAREPMQLDDDGDELPVGNLGTSILQRYDLAFDAVDQTMWAKVRHDAHGPFPSSRAGLQFAPHADGWAVVHVSPEWSGAGPWSNGDVVTHIDGQPASMERMLQAPSWDVGPVGSTVTFTLAGGATRTVTLTDWW